MPDPSILLATCLGCVSDPLVSQPQPSTQTQQQPHTQHTRSLEGSQATQGQATPTATPPSAQLQVARRSDEVPQFPIAYLWLLGWAVVYAGGSLFILKEVVKEVRGVPAVKAPVQEKDFAAALERLNTHRSLEGLTLTSSEATLSAQPHRSSTAKPTVKSTAKSSTSTSSTTQPKIVEKAIETPSGKTTPSASPEDFKQTISLQPGDRILEVAPAERGRVEPLSNLFVDLNDVNFAANSRSNKVTGLVVPFRANKAEKSPIDSQKALRKLIRKVSQALPSQECGVPQVASQDEEMLVATLPAPKQTNNYTYTLLDDAGGLFVLRGLELRVLNHQLQNHAEDTSVITVRRTDSQGMSVDKSFRLEVKKMQQRAVQPNQAERVPAQV